MPGKLLRSVLIGLLVGGLLLALMPSLRQWQLAPTTQNDTADDSPASYNAAVGGGGGEVLWWVLVAGAGRIEIEITHICQPR
ncbi:hypothetical protein ACTZN6_21025, partial [Klebsiella pneumoniae]